MARQDFAIIAPLVAKIGAGLELTWLPLAAACDGRVCEPECGKKGDGEMHCEVQVECADSPTSRRKQ